MRLTLVRRLPLLLLLLFSSLAFAGGALTLQLGSASDIVLDAGNGGTVNQDDASGPYDTTVGIRFLANGTVQTGKSLDGAAITWTAAGVWITPQSEASSVYDVRFTNLSQSMGSTDWTTEAAADNIWIDIGATRTWLSNKTTAGIRQFSVDFEVRDGGGAPPATGISAYTFDMENVI